MFSCGLLLGWQAIDLTNERPGWKRWLPADAWVKQIVDSEYRPRKTSAASHGLRVIGSRPVDHEIGRREEALLVD